MKKKNIASSVIFLLVLIFVLFLLDHVYSSQISLMNEKPIWAQKFKNAYFDFVVLGSSRSENTVDVKTIENKTGLKGLNIAYGGSAFAENYLALYTFYKNGNKCNTVLLNADEWGIIDQHKAYNYPFHGYYYFDLLSDDTIARLIKENYGSSKYIVWHYLPFIRYAEFNNIFHPVAFYQTRKPDYDEKGSALLSVHSKKPWIAGEEEMVPDDYSILNLNRIIAFCKQNKIEIILFNSPNFHEVLETKKHGSRDKCIDIIKNIALRNDLGYWDYSLQDALSYSKSFFYNGNHLNEAGAEIFSSMLAERIKSRRLR